MTGVRPGAYGHLGHHVGAGAVPGAPDWTASASALAAVTCYLLAYARLRRRGDAWPWRRTLSFAAGGAGIAVAALASEPAPRVLLLGLRGGDFTVHMAQHLIVGMAAPLLLVLGRPVTLALRALPAGAVRRGLVSAARSWPVAVLVFPVFAAVVDVGGLWVLYRTPLFAATDDRPWLHALVHLHVLTAGLLLSAAVCQLDPVRHRYPMPLRAATLVAAGAAHGVLAKTLWSTRPPGAAIPLTDLRTGAELMYYGGDLVEIALATVIALQWYDATGRAHRRQHRRARRPGVVDPRMPIRLRRAPHVIFLDPAATTCPRGAAQRRRRHRGGRHDDGGYDRPS